MNYNFTFTEDEIKVLGTVFDVAIKTTGISGAKQLLPLILKIEEVIKEQSQKAPEGDE